MTKIERIYSDLEERLTLEFINYILASNDYKTNVNSKVTHEDLQIHYWRCEWFVREIRLIREDMPKANLSEVAIWNEYRDKAQQQINKQ